MRATCRVRAGQSALLLLLNLLLLLGRLGRRLDDTESVRPGLCGEACAAQGTIVSGLL